MAQSQIASGGDHKDHKDHKVRVLDGLPDDTPYVISNLTTVAKLTNIQSLDLESVYHSMVAAHNAERSLICSCLSCSLEIRSVKLSRGVEEALEYSFLDDDDDSPTKTSKKRTKTKKKKASVVEHEQTREMTEDVFLSQTTKQAPKCVRKHFGNQITMVCRLSYGMQNDAERLVKSVNAKIFTNGALQLTGVHTFPQSRDIPAMLLDILSKVDVLKPKDVDVPMAVSDDRVCMINAVFSLNREIDRRRFCKFVHQNKSNIACSFDPCVHAAVRLQYFYNSDPRFAVNGACMCSSESTASSSASSSGGFRARGRCTGVGSDGHGMHACKKITILMFQSGKCSITGGQSKEQADAAHAFVVHLVKAYSESFGNST